MEDRDIVALFWARSDRAIAELSAKYERLCMRVANNILRDEMDAEECVNDAYLGVWNSVPPNAPDPLKTYVCRITRNLSLARYRKKTAKKRNSYYDAALEELEGCIPAAEDAEEASRAEEIASVLNSFLATLSVRDRSLFVCRYWFSDPIDVLADRFGMSTHAVSVRLFRIRQKLKNELNKRGITV